MKVAKQRGYYDMKKSDYGEQLYYQIYRKKFGNFSEYVSASKDPAGPDGHHEWQWLVYWWWKAVTKKKKRD